MSSWLSENLNEREEISAGPTRLNGWSLTNTGAKDRYVAFKNGEQTLALIVVPPREEVHIQGLDEPYTKGLAVESLTGDGKLIANVFYGSRGTTGKAARSTPADVTVEVHIK